jgi:hypothetical protein
MAGLARDCPQVMQNLSSAPRFVPQLPQSPAGQ